MLGGNFNEVLGGGFREGVADILARAGGQEEKKMKNFIKKHKYFLLFAIALGLLLPFGACEFDDPDDEPTSSNKPSNPAEKPAENPAEKPAENPAENPAEKPDYTGHPIVGDWSYGSAHPYDWFNPLSGMQGASGLARGYAFRADGTFSDYMVILGSPSSDGWWYSKGKYKIEGNKLVLFDSIETYRKQGDPLESYENKRQERDIVYLFEISADGKVLNINHGGSFTEYRPTNDFPSALK